MKEEKQINTREIISMEEYLSRRKKLREKESAGSRRMWDGEKNPTWMQVELYM